MMNPEALLLDEITSALDPENDERSVEYFGKSRKEGVCMLCVTHEMSFAKKLPVEFSSWKAVS